MLDPPPSQQPSEGDNRSAATALGFWDLHTPLGTHLHSGVACVSFAGVKTDPKTLRSCCSGEVTAPFNNPDA